MVGIWLTLVLLAIGLTMRDRRWPRMVRVPTGFLWLSAVGYSLYRTGLDLTVLLGLLAVILPVLIWLALCRWAPWPPVKSKWALHGLLVGAIVISLWLVVALKS